MSENQHQIPNSQKKSPRAAQYQELYDRGLNCSEIAREAGVSTSAVAQWLKARGLPPRGSGNLPDDVRQSLPDGEEVRPVPDAPAYLVTRAGAVYSTRTDPPQAMVPRRTSYGPKVALSVRGRMAYRFVAPLVLEAWVSPRPEGCVAKFRDGDRANCHADNLEWAPGSRRLDPAELVSVWQSAGSLTEVAERLGVSAGTAYQAAERLRDKGVPLKRFGGGLTPDQIQELIRLAEEPDDA